MSSVMAPLVVDKYPLPPKPAAPVSLADMRKFPLHPVRRAALHLAHQVRNRQLRRHQYEHVDVVTRRHPAQDVDPVLAANLVANVAHSEGQIAGQHLVGVFGRPDDSFTLKRYRLEVGGFASERGY